MDKKYILIARSKLVENTISPYNNNSYNMDGLVQGINNRELQKPIHVCPIPNTDLFEIIDSIMRNRAYGILNRTHIECIVLNIQEAEKPELIIELNRTRQKDFLDKLEEGYLILKTIPKESGERNDLKGNATGKTRTDKAGEKVGVSGSSLEKYAALMALHEKYPDRKVKSTLKRKESSLSKIYADELAHHKSVVEMEKALEAMNNLTPAFKEMIINPNSQPKVSSTEEEEPENLTTDSVCIYNKPCEEMRLADIPRIWLLPHVRKVGITSIPYWDQATYNPNNPNELGHEKTAEEFLANLKPMMSRAYEMFSSGESYFVNLNDTYQGDKNNTIPELFVAMMTKELGYHKVATIIWHKVNTTMKGRIEKRPYNSWEYFYWFVKDAETFYKDNSG